MSFVAALRGLGAFALLCTGCAVVWDIEPARLDPRDAGAVDSAKPDVKPAPGCQVNGEACNDCIAASCCQQYNACLQDTVCNQALVTYDLCASTALDGGGSQCAETFGTAALGAQALVQCVFLSACKTQCSFQRLRSSCAEYCLCMEGSCPGAQFTAGTCMDTCALLAVEQLDCRAYHCQFAASDPASHCPHALGESVCP